MDRVVERRQAAMLTGKVPVTGGEAVARWGRTQTSGTEATSDRHP